MIAAGFIVAGKPIGPTSGFGIQHLFRRPGEWSLCEEAVWLEVVRAELVNPLTWICVRCKALAADEPDPCPPRTAVPPEPAAVPDRPSWCSCHPELDGACPYCGGRLEVWALFSDRAWICTNRDCGRLHFEGSPLATIRDEPRGRRAEQ